VSLPVSASTLATPCNIYADSIHYTRGDNEHELLILKSEESRYVY